MDYAVSTFLTPVKIELQCPRSHSLPPQLRMSTNPLEKDFDNNVEVGGGGGGEAIVMRNSIGRRRRNER